MKTQLLTTLENARQYTVSVANAMPESAYTFKPADTVWSFNELVQHIAYGIAWWEENYINGNKKAWDPPALHGSKPDAIKKLESAFDNLKATVSRKTLSEDAVNGFHATLDHVTHHRGQAIVYLRCKGIAPPEYIY